MCYLRLTSEGHVFVYNGFPDNWGQKVKVNPFG